MLDKDGPDAVCAALLCADGMMPLPPSTDGEIPADRGDGLDFDVNSNEARLTARNEDAESDKENAPLRI